jgi:metal-sulfur cluster biosynthetic enzyme
MENGTTIDHNAAGEELQADVAATSAIPADELDRLTTDIVGALKTVYDPEIPCDIYELGLIYKVDIEDDRSINIDMTLTAPGCPVAGEMPGWVENAVCVRGRCRAGQCRHGLRSALDAGAHVRRSQGGAELVLRRRSLFPSTWQIPICLKIRILCNARG